MRFSFPAIAVVAVTFSGCATLKPMELQSDFWQQPNKKLQLLFMNYLNQQRTKQVIKVC